MASAETKVKANRSWRMEDTEKPKPLSAGNVKFAEEVMESARGKMEDVKKGFMDQVDEQLQDLIDDCFSEIRCKMMASQENASSSSSDDKSSARLSGDSDSSRTTKAAVGDGLPRKQFVHRDSVLTDLFRVSHIRTIYHIFTAALLLIVLQSAVHEVSKDGKLDFSFSMIWWTFGKIHSVLLMWVCMFLGTCALFVAFSMWASQPEFHNFTWDVAFVLAFVHYIGLFLYYPVVYLLDHDLPVASSFIILMEQTRMLMKSYSFVRHNVPTAVQFHRNKKAAAGSDVRKASPVANGGPERRKTSSSESEPVVGPCPDFSNFLYFMFAPTLVYRDSYPRTKKVRWSYVLTNFIQVFGVIMALYFILAKLIFPVLDAVEVDADGNPVPPTFVWILQRAFNCVLPATFCALICWFGLLHSWLNAFAEMLRFGDREFYSDWWNSTSYTRYYRKWNIVVHDWLYEYIYRDVYALGFNPFNLGRRFVPTCAVFFVSALFHEYIISVAFRFFYPVLLVMFGGFGFGFMFLPKSSNSKSLVSVLWNVFLWMNLMLGFSLLIITYSLEFFARSSCAPVSEHLFWQYLVPRSWTCSLASAGSESRS